MKKVLFVILAMDHFSCGDSGRFRIQDIQRRPLLGVLYLCSMLESHGIECEVLDQGVAPFTAEELIQKIRQQKYCFVGFYAQEVITNKVIEYIKKLRTTSSDLPLVVGGPGGIYYKDFLSCGCDVVCRGESEYTLLDIIDYLESRRQIDTIDGIAYVQEGEIITTKQRQPIENLDVLPFPSWEHLSMDAYYDYSIIPLKYPFAVMMTSRGCPFKCAFCGGPYFWNYTYRTRSVENVLDEIDVLVKESRAKYIIFQDDIFGFDIKWLAHFCSSLTDRNYHALRWMCIVHPFTFKENCREIIQMLKKAGCNLLVIGLQAVNPDILKGINRSPQEPHIVKQIVENARKAGIMTCVDFILGFPGETQQTIAESIHFALEASPHIVNFHPLWLSPGSQLERCYQDKKLTDLSGEMISDYCKKANRSICLRPVNILRILKYLIREDPRLLFKTRQFYSVFQKVAISQHD